ncbi:MAG: hypothetical protein CSA86_02480 [Arcobacter sp.]|nr:MAG: hypothetical protein CSA86_02480 [Arcobacter sp.]
MILIYTALLCEAQSFIEYYKLKKVHSTPKIYANDKIVVCIGGIKEKNTLLSLEYIYTHYTITKAFNIGIAGCNNNNIQIGNLYCINHKLKGIETLPLITSNSVVTHSNSLATSLYDMEGKYFYEKSLEYLNKEDIFIFKIVSDHLSTTILEKDTIKNLISQHKILYSLFKLI